MSEAEKADTRAFLRVCPESLRGLAEAPQHEADGGETKECQRLAVEVLPVLGEATAAIEPSEGSFHDPPPGQHLEALGLVGAFDDLDLDAAHGGPQSALELLALVAAIGVELQQEGKEAEQVGHEHDAAAAIVVESCGS